MPDQQDNSRPLAGLDLEVIRRHFPYLQELVYLNTGTAASPALPARERWRVFVDDFYDSGPALPRTRQKLRAEFDRAREVVASRFGANVSAVAFTENTTQGLNHVLCGFPWVEGDTVVTTDIEHPALTMPLQYNQERFGYEIKVLESVEGLVPLTGFKKALEDGARMVCVSHVSYSTGGRVPLAELGAMCRDAGAFLLVDGAQSYGALILKLAETPVDAYAVPGYKWSTGPEGVGALYLDPRWDQVIKPTYLGLRGIAENNDDGSFRLESGAKRFEGSTAGFLNYVAWAYALDYLNEIGPERIANQINRLSGHFIDLLKDLPGVKVITPAADELRAGIVTFTIPSETDYRPIVQRLLEDEGILIRSVGGPSAGLRASFHFYNSEGDVQRLIDALGRLVGR